MNKETRKRSNDDVNLHALKKQSLSCGSTVSIDAFYLVEDFIQSLSDAFQTGNSMVFGNGAKFMSDPFCCCVLPNFLNSTDYLNSLFEELKQLKMNDKKNDLFKFKQSIDLGSISSPHINTLKMILYKNCLPWMKKITGITLNETIDMSCSAYNYGDVLLCHDDLLDSRRIAFILYLVPDWQIEDGGSLDLFNCEDGKPTDIATSLCPVWNNFIFFEVSSASFHQVSEILSKKVRLSISGWYHGPPISSKKGSIIEDTSLLISPISFRGDITKWINSLYLQPDIQIQIRQTFKENSEIELSDFLQQHKYLELANTLNSCRNWNLVGPANLRRYEELYDMSDIIKECIDVFQSEEMCLLLSNLSGLALHEMAVVDSSDSSDDDKANNQAKSTSSVNNLCATKISKSVRKWTHGYYTLLSDYGKSKCCLEATIAFNCDEWKHAYGGYTSYIAKDEVDELLVVLPKSNHISLVYTDEETSSFVNYINCKSLKRNQPFFQDIFVTYYEN